VIEMAALGKRSLLNIFLAPLMVISGFSAFAEDGSPAAQSSPNRLERKGLVVQFDASPVEKGKTNDIVEGDDVDIRFTVNDASTGRPMKGLAPGSWLDPGVASSTGGERRSESCETKLKSYFKGAVSIRPQIDLSSYYILSFNRDASISVIDPLVGFAGKTNLLGTIALNAAPADWAKSRDGKRLYVTLPGAGQVAAIDMESFKVVKTIEAGAKPTRVALQGDGGYLWIGNDGDMDDAGGVTIVDTQSLETAAHIATGKGHHELAFSEDGRFAYVSNREKGSVSIVDAARFVKQKDIATGSAPVALAYSKIAQALYVADGVDGTVSVIQGDEPAIVALIHAKPGLGPIRLTPDGRWALVANPKENLVDVIEIATNRVVQSISIGARPYYIAFSEAFAYVRSLDSEHVGMISLAQLSKPTAAQVSAFAAGASAPSGTDNLGLGAPISPAFGEAAVVVASPGDNLIYYYMEGMLAPSGSFRNPGHQVGAVDVFDRSLKETQPGVYSARVKAPAAGEYDVAFLLGAPIVNECFHLKVASNPSRAHTLGTVSIDYLAAPNRASAGEVIRWRFRLADPQSGRPKVGLKDVQVLYYAAPGLSRSESLSRELGDGIYEADLSLRNAGAYYVYVASSSLHLGFGDLPYRNLLVN
jgi:YVTN family beta-propeller protein